MALPEASSKGGQNSKAKDQDDKDFDPTPEALIDEIDDERTLEEEEAFGGINGAAVQEELDDLKKESEMPIEELLAYYEKMRNEAQEGSNSEEEEEDDEDEEEEDDVEEDEDEEDQDGDGRNEKPGRKGSAEGGDGSNLDRVGGSQDKQQDKPSQSSFQDKQSGDPKQAPTSSEHKAPTENVEKLTSPPNFSTTNLDAAHSTITPHEEQPEANEEPQTMLNQLSQCLQSDAVEDSARLSQSRPRHPMTDFNIDDDEGGMFKSLLGYDLDDSDDMDEDYSYTDDENGDDERDWRRVIHVGPEHQADVPDGLCKYDDLPPYENQDTLVWECNSDLTQEQILDYLKQASTLSKRQDISISSASVPKISNDSLRLYREKMQDITSSTGSHLIDNEQLLDSTTDVYMRQSRKRARIDHELEQENAMDGVGQINECTQSQATNSKEDNSDSASQDAKPELSTEEYFQDEEQLLFLLLQCNHNFDESLRRRKLDPFKYYLHEPMTLWSQEECLDFEHGLKTYGKDFRSIRENKVKTRKHAELVAFYYLWKKSERHDVYTNQYKLNRKRCLTHPGTTDYMDKFIEDNGTTVHASSSSTPTPTETNHTDLTLCRGGFMFHPHDDAECEATAVKRLLSDARI